MTEHDAKGLEIIAGWLERDGLIEPATMLRRLAAGASEGQTFEQWIADKGINPKIYTSQSNPGGAYGWAQKAWRARDAELTALRKRIEELEAELYEARNK